MVEPEGRFFRGEGRTSAGQAERVWSAGQTIFYFLLLPLSFLPILVMGWDFSTHAIVSGIVAVIFIFVMMQNYGLWKSALIVGAVYAVDVGFIALPIELISSTEIGQVLIAVKLFVVWPGLAIVVYLIDVFKTEDAPTWSKIVALVLIIGVFALIVPTLGIDSYTQTVKSHEQYQIAKEKAEELGEAAKELLVNKTVPFWQRFVSAVPHLFSGDLEKYRETLNPPQNLTEQIETAGAVDPTIKRYTKVEFLKGEEFPKTIYDKRYPIPIQMKVESPRNPIDLEISCRFESGSKKIEGSASPTQLTVQRNEVEERVVTCFPNQDLSEGSWKVVMESKIANLETDSTLRRLFVGEKTQEEKDQLRRDYFPQSNDYKSQAPKEFVRINFLIGEPPSNPIIDSEDTPLLTAVVENIGSGELTGIDSVDIELPEGLRPISDPARCSLLDYAEYEGRTTHFIKRDFQINKLEKGKNLPVGICVLEVEPRLKYPEEPFIHTTAVGTIKYTYRIENTFSFRAESLVG